MYTTCCTARVFGRLVKEDFMDKDILLIVMILIAAIIVWLMWILLRPSFFHELRFLNMEISRTEGEAQAYWKSCRVRLLLSLIPFVKYRR